jgi:hypothetical protein
MRELSDEFEYRALIWAYDHITDCEVCFRQLSRLRQRW